MKKLFVFIMTMMCLHGMAIAQHIEASATISDNEIRVGKPFNVNVLLKVPYGYMVETPTLDNEALGEQLNIINIGPAERTADADSSTIVKQQLTLMTFDTGIVVLPPIHLTYSVPDDIQQYQATTNALELHSTTISINPDEPFKPIAPPISKPLKFRELLPYLLAVIVAILLAVAVLLLLKRYKARKPETKDVEDKTDKTPPYDKAINNLQTLRQQKLWQAGKQKEYYSSLTDIIREYIEGQFGVNAVEMTTNDILEAIKPLNFDGRLFDSFKDTMQLADLVKFAKYQPASLDNDKAINDMIDFVNESYAHYQDMQQKEASDNVNNEKEVQDVG